MGIAQQNAGSSLTALDINQLPVVVSYLATGSGGTSSTAEVVVGTFTIPAGDPTFPGGYWWKLHATGTAAGSPTCTFRMRLGTVTGTLIGDASGTFSVSPGIIQAEGWLGFESIGSSGTFGVFCNSFIVLNGATVNGPFQTDAVAINTTIANNIVATVQFSASSASNSVTTKFGSLYRL